jgi:hypothetical protein
VVSAADPDADSTARVDHVSFTSDWRYAQRLGHPFSPADAVGRHTDDDEEIWMIMTVHDPR